MELDLNGLALMMAQGVTDDKSTRKSTLALIAQHESPLVRSFVAQVISEDNPDITEVLSTLAMDADDDVRSGVAQNVGAPTEKLRLLSQDSVSQVVQNVAGNISTPPEILVKFGESSDSALAGIIALNPSTPQGTLELLASRGELDVKENVALNPSTSDEVRLNLLPLRTEKLAESFNVLAQSKSDADFIELLARRLLWFQLGYQGAQANLELINANESFDSLRLECFFPSNEGIASWEVFFTDPIEDQNSDFDVSIFRDGLLDTWPSPMSWTEFGYGELLATPMEPEDDEEFERLCSDSWPSDWPSLLVDTGYGMWAYLDLAQTGRISQTSFMESLRTFPGIPAIGQVEVIAKGAITNGSEKPIPCEAKTVIAVLSRAREIEQHSVSDPEAQRTINAVRDLIEPLLIVTPDVPVEIVEFILEEPSNLVARLASVNSALPEKLREGLAISASPSMPDGCTIEMGLSHPRVRTWNEGEGQAENADLLQESSPEAHALRYKIAQLIQKIMSEAPSPDGEGDDGDIDTSVGRHKRFLQAMIWIGGSIYVSLETLSEWVEALTELSESLSDEDCDPEYIEELAFNSWSN